jgi:hypothetical protein
MQRVTKEMTQTNKKHYLHVLTGKKPGEGIHVEPMTDASWQLY